MDNKPITELESNYRHLEVMSVDDILNAINSEDMKVARAVKEVLPTLSQLIEAIVKRRQRGGRIFYIGAGTSGRLGVLDASECPPTFGVSPDQVIALIAGGDSALRASVEFAEDDEKSGWQELEEFHPSSNDTLIGIAASGKTPYVIGALRSASQNGLLTACITCNPNSDLSKVVDYAVEVNVGPEFVTGSTRMKSGTAQKMILNMITTACMVRQGRVKGNKMVDMQLANKKLQLRAQTMLQEELGVDEEEAREMISQSGSVRKALERSRSKDT